MIKHLIDGEPVGSQDVFQTLDPATAEVIDEVAGGDEAEVAAAVEAARRAFPAWAAKPAAERASLMRRLGDLIAQNVPELSTLETQDTGQVIAQTKKALIPRAADNFYFFSEVCTRLDGECYQSDDHHLSYTLYHPVGVCALISPWNVPFMTATWKVAPCLALGNTAVLKMSELSPVTADRLGRLALEAGIPPGVLNVVHGFGATAGDALVRHPDVRAISFTGSTATGNQIVSRAGLKKFSMELGGKSPFIVFDDADQERALDAAVFMIFSNNGERCTAGRRCRELAVDTIVVFDVHWLVNAGYHVNCCPRFQGVYTSNELPHFMAYDYPGNPALGHLIAETATAHGVFTRAHEIPSLELEYGTLVPMRYMNGDRHFKVVSVAAWCNWHTLDESRRFGAAVAKAIERSDSSVAVFASGSLSHRFNDNGSPEESIHQISDEFYRQVDLRVVELWRSGNFKDFCAMLPLYAQACQGEGRMHDTAMLLGMLGWDRYAGKVEVITDYFASSGTGQINAVFPLPEPD